MGWCMAGHGHGHGMGRKVPIARHVPAPAGRVYLLVHRAPTG